MPDLPQNSRHPIFAFFRLRREQAAEQPTALVADLIFANPDMPVEPVGRIYFGVARARLRLRNSQCTMSPFRLKHVPSFPDKYRVVWSEEYRSKVMASMKARFGVWFIPKPEVEGGGEIERSQGSDSTAEYDSPLIVANPTRDGVDIDIFKPPWSRILQGRVFGEDDQGATIGEISVEDGDWQITASLRIEKKYLRMTDKDELPFLKVPLTKQRLATLVFGKQYPEEIPLGRLTKNGWQESD